MADSLMVDYQTPTQLVDLSQIVSQILCPAVQAIPDVSYSIEKPPGPFQL
jgi:hypothetical protein